MDSTRTWVGGAALAVTVGVIYVVCAIAVVLFPDGTLAFFSTWAHGVDLTLVKRPPAKPLTAGEWIYGFVSAVAAGYVVGALYGWARNLFSGHK
jgi:hypothetical protein